MAGRPPGRKKIIENTVKMMQEMGTYKPAYDPVIETYVELRLQLTSLMKQWEEQGYVISEPTAAGGEKKAAIVSVIESLRKDVLAYSDRLCLTPKSMAEEKSKKKVKKSRLDEMLSNA